MEKKRGEGKEKDETQTEERKDEKRKDKRKEKTRQREKRTKKSVESSTFVDGKRTNHRFPIIHYFYAQRNHF